jgi:hypothetical protein
MKHVLRLFSGTIRYLRTRRTELARRYMIHLAALTASCLVLAWSLSWALLRRSPCPQGGLLVNDHFRRESKRPFDVQISGG